MVRRQYPKGTLTLFSGTRVDELSAGSDLFDERVDIYGPDAGATVRKCVESDAFDWVINLENSPLAQVLAGVLAGAEGAVTGPCVGADGRGTMPYEDTPQGRLLEDKEWISAELTSRYPFLRSGFIGEIFARTAYLEGEVPRYKLVEADPGDVPETLIATAASLSSKLWPVEKWAELVRRLAAEGGRVGLLGAKPSDQKKFWKGSDDESEILAQSPLEDLRGTLTLPQVVGAVRKARQVVTLDNGILHLACATETPTVGLFRNGIHRLWAPPVANLRVVEPGAGRSVADLTVDEIVQVLKNFQPPLTYF